MSFLAKEPCKQVQGAVELSDSIILKQSNDDLFRFVLFLASFVIYVA